MGAGDVGGQALSLWLIDHVAIDIVPVSFVTSSSTAAVYASRAAAADPESGSAAAS